MTARPRRTDLYRLYDAAGRLLYVGIGYCAKARFIQHATKPWRPDVARRDVRRLESREAAARAEKQAIRTERPIWNAQHRPPFTAEEREYRLRRGAAFVERDEQALYAAIAAARLDGHSFREIGGWAGVNHERARTIAIRINGDSRTRAEREAAS